MKILSETEAICTSCDKPASVHSWSMLDDFEFNLCIKCLESAYTFLKAIEQVDAKYDPPEVDAQNL